MQNQNAERDKLPSEASGDCAAFILHSAFCNLRSGNRRAFTAIELLVAVFVMVVLASILVPYIATLRESARRTQCEANLQQIRDALHHYATANKFQYPRVVYDAQTMPNSYTCFTGPDASNPFAAGSAVKPNDVTASLWLLVRDGLVRDTNVFVCPSAGGWRDPLTDGSGRFVKPDQRGNFREAGNLSYGYSSPFSAAPRYRMDDTREGDFAIMADKGPGFPAAGPVAGPPQNAPPLQQAPLNSPNHDHAGQNVLYRRWQHSVGTQRVLRRWPLPRNGWRQYLHRPHTDALERPKPARQRHRLLGPDHRPRLGIRQLPRPRNWRRPALAAACGLAAAGEIRSPKSEPNPNDQNPKRNMP